MESSEWRPEHLIVRLTPTDREGVEKYVRHMRQCMYAIEMALTAQDLMCAIHEALSGTSLAYNEVQALIQQRVQRKAVNN